MSEKSKSRASLSRRARPDYRAGGRGDLFDRNMCVKWTVSAMIAIYIISFGLYGIVYLNINEIHTWFSVPGDPCGSLVSTRYNNITYWAISFTSFRIFFMVALFGIIGFKRVVGCTTAWVAIMILVASIDFFVWIILLSNVVVANTPDHPNMCDDPLKCNAPEFYTNPVPNRCTNTAATPRDIELIRSDLKINEDCKWLFATNTAWLFIMDATLLGFTLIIWVGVTSWDDLERFAKKTRDTVNGTIDRVRNGRKAVRTAISSSIDDNDPLTVPPPPPPRPVEVRRKNAGIIRTVVKPPESSKNK